MHVVSLAPVPVSSMVWRYGDGPWTLSVLCKITMRLEPKMALIAKSHDPIHERDIAGAGSAGFAHAPADLIPLRTAVDVTLVGDAYAAGVSGQVSARLAVGDIDRRAMVEPRAGSCPAPSGFGPLAGTAPMRQSLLGGAAAPQLDDDEMSLPVGFDMDYFAAAPPEQRLDELDPGAVLRLEHLHPDHRNFETQLPNVSPQVFVQRGRKRSERPAIVDALWIDSRRALATLSWRCLIPLASRHEEGRVWVTVAGPGRRMTSSQLSELIRELGGKDEFEPELDDDDDPMGRTMAIPLNRPPPPKRKPRTAEARPADTAVAVVAPKVAEPGVAVTNVAASGGGAGSAGVGLAGVGLAGVGSAGVGSAGAGSAGVGLAGVGSAGPIPPGLPVPQLLEPNAPPAGGSVGRGAAGNGSAAVVGGASVSAPVAKVVVATDARIASASLQDASVVSGPAPTAVATPTASAVSPTSRPRPAAGPPPSPRARKPRSEGSVAPAANPAKQPGPDSSRAGGSRAAGKRPGNAAFADTGQHTSALRLGVLRAAADAGPAWLNPEPPAAEVAASAPPPLPPPPAIPPGASRAIAPPTSANRPPGSSAGPANGAAATQAEVAAAASNPAAPNPAAPNPAAPNPAASNPAAPNSAAPNPTAAKAAAPASPWSSPGAAPPLRDSKMEDTANLPVGAAAATSSSGKASTSLSEALSSVSESLASPGRSAPLVTVAAAPALLQAKMAGASSESIDLTVPAAAASPKPTAKPRKRRRGSTRPLDMLWFDDTATIALRQRWSTLCTELDFAPPDKRHDLPSKDPELARAHHTHFGVLAQVDTVVRGGLRNLLQQSVAEDGRFTPPLCALDGELKVSFDPVEALRALVVAMKPFTTDDKKLENAISNVLELIDDKASTSQTLQSGRRHVREVFKASKRSTSLETLDQAVGRTLLEQRKYERRTLLGSTWIRAKLQWGSNAVVCYLDEALQNRLPMMMSFEARVVGEAQPRQDQFETPPYAMRVVTLGRFVKF